MLALQAELSVKHGLHREENTEKQNGENTDVTVTSVMKTSSVLACETGRFQE